uniref:F-box/kelch-repeat protein At3g23880-like n=1 Tax=Erigeron canadensis TaxID=72917 RepID=UPI001CB9A4A8|nr:F-box/kelch-repeat protein At3g23880-like [Erigeron canadensis]
MSDYISSELIDEIFTRLPVKSLLRFRTLSKSICARISSPDFIRKHALQSPPKYLIRHRYFDCHENFDYYTVHSEDQLPLRNSGGYNDETTFKFPYRDTFKIGGSCNGILCVYEKAAYSYYFVLWNPSIRRKLTLPEVPFEDPIGSDKVSVGFGFDSLNNDYKIVWFSIAEYRLPSVLASDNSWIWVLREEHDDTSCWSVYSESHGDVYKRERDKFYELSTTGDFLLQNYYTTPEVYNLETETKALQMRIEDSPNVEIEKYVESLELLGAGLLGKGKAAIFCSN